MNRLARLDIVQGGPDGSPVLEDFVSGLDHLTGDLVSRKNLGFKCYRLVIYDQRCLGIKLAAGNTDIVFFAQDQQAGVREGLGHKFNQFNQEKGADKLETKRRPTTGINHPDQLGLDDHIPIPREQSRKTER